MGKNSRRSFIKKTGFSALSVPFLNLWPTDFGFEKPLNETLQVHIFSKHLQFLDFRAVGEKAAEMGFAGVDLTVRPNGHVAPGQAEDVLPQALDAIRAAGSECCLMTTAVGSIQNKVDLQVLKVAAANKVRFYRCNWYDYGPEVPMAQQLINYSNEIRDLSELNSQLGLVGCYQNHSGLKVGASLWEVMTLLSKADPKHFGSQFDIRHAVVEGGLSWENNLRLIQDHIKTIVLKDFIWKMEGGKWTVQNVPLGEGMVDFKKYFKILKQYHINVPAILHMEYSLGGAEHGKRDIEIPKATVYNAMKRDLEKTKQLWSEA